MNEHMMPIPSRLYNAAVGGHVCGPEDVDFGQKVVHLVKYDRAGNEVSFESQVTQANKIYVIHDDFVLSSNVTIPTNCVLEFDGGSVSGAHTITGNNTSIQAGLVKIFNIDVTLAGTWNVRDVYPEWFGAVEYDANNIIDDTISLQKSINFTGITTGKSAVLLSKFYAVSTITLSNFAAVILGTSHEECGFVGIQENSSVLYITGVSAGNRFENFRIAAIANGVVGIFSDAVCISPLDTAGFWNSVIDNIYFYDCNIAIKFDARDDRPENDGRDVANQVFVVKNIITEGTKYVDLHFIGQVGQNSFKDCLFIGSDSKENYILIDTPSTSGSDSCYLQMEDCSFVGSTTDVFIKVTGIHVTTINFQRCWFENIYTSFITSSALGLFGFIDCYFLNCHGDYFCKNCQATNQITVLGGQREGSFFTNAFDATTAGNLNTNIRCDTGLFTNYGEAGLQLIRRGETGSVGVAYKHIEIIDSNRKFPEGSLNAILWKHDSNNYNIVGIKQGNDLLGYFRLEQIIDFVSHDSKYFPLQRQQIPLYGTTTERTDVIDTSLISIGLPYFDTDLGKQLWWNGSAWVDATGTAV